MDPTSRHAFDLGVEMAKIEEQRIWHVERSLSIIEAGLREIHLVDKSTPPDVETRDRSNAPQATSATPEQDDGMVLDVARLADNMFVADRPTLWPDANTLRVAFERASAADDVATVSRLDGVLRDREKMLRLRAAALDSSIDNMRQMLTDSSNDARFIARLLEFNRTRPERSDPFRRHLALLFPNVGDELRAATAGQVSFSTPLERTLATASGHLRSLLSITNVDFVADDDEATRAAGVELARLLRKAFDEGHEADTLVDTAIDPSDVDSKTDTENDHAVFQPEHAVRASPHNTELDLLPMADANARVLRTSEKALRQFEARAIEVLDIDPDRWLTFVAATRDDTRLASTLAFLPALRRRLVEQGLSVGVVDKDVAVAMLLQRRPTPPFSGGSVGTTVAQQSLPTASDEITAGSVDVASELLPLATAHPESWLSFCEFVYRRRPDIVDVSARLRTAVVEKINEMRGLETTSASFDHELAGSAGFPDLRHTAVRAQARGDTAALAKLQTVLDGTDAGLELTPEIESAIREHSRLEERACFGAAVLWAGNEDLNAGLQLWSARSTDAGRKEDLLSTNGMRHATSLARRQYLGLPLDPSTATGEPIEHSVEQLKADAERLVIEEQQYFDKMSALRWVMWSFLASQRDITLQTLDQLSKDQPVLGMLAEEGPRLQIHSVAKIDVDKELVSGSSHDAIARQLDDRQLRLERSSPMVNDALGALDETFDILLENEPEMLRRITSSITVLRKGPRGTPEAVQMYIDALAHVPRVDRQVRRFTLGNRHRTAQHEKATRTMLRLLLAAQSEPVIGDFLRHAVATEGDILGDSVASLPTVGVDDSPREIDLDNEVLRHLEDAHNGPLPPILRLHCDEAIRRQDRAVRLMVEIETLVSHMLRTHEGTAVALTNVIDALPYTTSDEGGLDRQSAFDALERLSSCHDAIFSSPARTTPPQPDNSTSKAEPTIDGTADSNDSIDDGRPATKADPLPDDEPSIDVIPAGNDETTEPHAPDAATATNDETTTRATNEQQSRTPDDSDLGPSTNDTNGAPGDASPVPRRASSRRSPLRLTNPESPPSVSTNDDQSKQKGSPSLLGRNTESDSTTERDAPSGSKETNATHLRHRAPSSAETEAARPDPTTAEEPGTHDPGCPDSPSL